MEEYNPKPKVFSDIQLPPAIVELTERLARNTHDLWARQRMDEGWKFGPERDDARKQHPGLVPYDELSDSEKEYDRQTALEAIKLILSEGFEIKKNG
jgi:hypothetical protein